MVILFVILLSGEEEVVGGQIYNMECFKEVYYHVQSKGSEGCTLQYLQKHIGVDNKTIRMALKKLAARQVVDVKRFDMGKQRHLVYYARSLADKSVEIPDPEPKKSTTSVIARIKERQRLAREKLGLTGDEPDKVEEPSLEFPRIINLDVPSFSCPFFVRTWTELYEKLRDGYVKANFTSKPRNDVIKLNTRSFGTEQSFEINKILTHISSMPITPPIKDNIGDYYVAKTDVNHVTKLILLKATLGEIVINIEDLSSSSRKRKRPAEVTIPKLSGNVEDKHKPIDKNLQFMGDNPMVIFSEKEGHLSAEIIVSTPPVEFKYEKTYPKRKDLSERVLFRIKVILEQIHEKKIFEDMYKMVKVIQEVEMKDGKA